MFYDESHNMTSAEVDHLLPWSFVLEDRTWNLVLAEQSPKDRSMKEYKPDTIDDVRLVLRGLDHRMKVEIEPGIPLAAKTVWDLRARATWPSGLRLILPHEREHSESVVKIERV
jgi:hypothetical protein